MAYGGVGSVMLGTQCIGARLGRVITGVGKATERFPDPETGTVKFL